MVEVTSAPSIASTSFKKVAVKPTKSKPRVKPSSHPPTSEMVQAAIFSLKDRHGSSLQAIKKYIIINYDLNAEKIAPFVKRYIKLAVSKGKLIQTKGKGASGSFKLPPENREPRDKSSKTSIKERDLRKNSKVNIAESNKSTSVKKSVVSIRKSTSKIPKSTSKVKEIKPEEKIIKKGKKLQDVGKKSPKVKKNNKITTTKPKAPKPKKK